MVGSKYVDESNPLPVYLVGGGGSGDIPDGSITTEKLSNGAVTTEKIANNAITTNKFNANAKAPAAVVADSANSVAWNNVNGKPSSYPPSTHDHNNLYYTKEESDSKYQAKGDYITEAEFANALDSKADLVYVDSQLTNKADIAYVNTQLSNKADTSYVNTQLNTKLTASKMEFQAESTATDIETLVNDFNALLQKLIEAGIMNQE